MRLNRKAWSASVERVAVVEVDLHLRRARLVDQRVDVEVLRLAEVVDVVEQRVELVDRVDAVGLAADLGAARAADRRLQRIVRVGVRLDQEEFEFRRDHGRQPRCRVELEHAAQHVARRHRHRAAVVVEAVVDHLRGRLGGPGHDADRLRVAGQHDVDLRRVNRAVVVRVFAGDGLQEQRLGQAHALVLGVLLRRHDLAARDAGHVGDDGLDLGDRMILQQLLDVAHRLRLVRAFTAGLAEGREQRA